MSKTVKTVILLLIIYVAPASAQTRIELDIPSCYHLQYILSMKQEATLDTVAVGRFDDKGQATFTLPDRYASFRGAGNLSVRGSYLNVNLIFNGEDGVVVREDTIADQLVASSPENDYLNTAFARQRQIIEDYNKAVSGGQAAVFALPEFRLAALQNEYKQYWQEVNASPLYAARMVELISCLSGISNSLNVPPDSVVTGQHLHLTDKVDFRDLYTSGFWQLALDVWYQAAQGDDSLLLNSARRMLDRTRDVFVRRELTQSLVRQFIRYGKDSLLAELGTEYLTIPVNGQPAPEIVAGTSTFIPKLSLILFYETGCGNCHYELHQLKEQHKLLADNGIRVITISADVDKGVNNDTAAGFPWADNVCTLQGFDGDNFRNYGILGTPTYILTDGDGIVRGRYARLKELLNN